jgi:hypothetical protein
MSGRLLLPLLPLAVSLAVPWVRYREAQALRHGVPLSEDAMAFAVRLGIQKAETIRLLKVDAVRVFDAPLLRLPFHFANRSFRFTAGITLRYGILIRADFWNEPGLIAHELVHVHQYERLGGIAPFLWRYLRECLVDGYPFSRLEQEAVTRSRDPDSP